MADAPDFIHAVLVAEPLVQENPGVLPLALKAIAGLAHIELVGDVDLRHESLAVLYDKQHVLTLERRHGKPVAGARVAEQEAVEHGLPVVTPVRARLVLHQATEEAAGRETVEVGLLGFAAEPGLDHV